MLTNDSQEELREALCRLIFSADGRIRWIRLELPLDETNESTGFDVVLVVDKLVDYVVSSKGETRGRATLSSRLPPRLNKSPQPVCQKGRRCRGLRSLIDFSNPEAEEMTLCGGNP